MRPTRAAIWLPMLCCIAGARAEDSASTALCRIVAHDLWMSGAPTPLHEQTPLAQLPALKHAPSGLTNQKQSIADVLIQDHAADPDLVQKLHDTPPAEATRFGDSDIWLLDRVDGTLGCHTPMTVAVPASGSSHEIELPGQPDPTALCGLSALAAVSIDGTPALWIEQSGAFSNALVQSTVSIAALDTEAFAAPCSVAVDYTITDRATHAFCDGIDCVPLVRTAEILAMRLRQQEPAESLGAGAVRNDQDAATYRRMKDLVAAEKQPAELPTFGVPLDTPYLTFADQVTFPVRLGDGPVYLVRMGHGGFGWRQTADTLVALYRLTDDHLAPAASVYVSAQRTGIQDVVVQ